MRLEGSLWLPGGMHAKGIEKLSVSARSSSFNSADVQSWPRFRQDTSRCGQLDSLDLSKATVRTLCEGWRAMTDIMALKKAELLWQLRKTSFQVLQPYEEDLFDVKGAS